MTKSAGALDPRTRGDFSHARRSVAVTGRFDRGWARLRKALHAVYANDPSIEEIRDADLLGECPSVRYYPPSGDLYLDVMTRLGEGASYETVEAEIKEIEGIRVRVATPAALYRLKKGTLRPLDHRDAAALAARFGLEKGD